MAVHTYDDSATTVIRVDRPALRAFGTLLGVLGLVALNLLVLAGAGGPLRAVLGFPVVVLLPGALALRVIGLDQVAGWTWLVRVVALSTAGLTAIGLVLGLLPGAALSAPGSLIGLDLLVGALAGVLIRGGSFRGTATDSAAEFLRLAEAGARAAVRSLLPDRTMALLAAATLLPGAIAVGLAVAGAVRLDDGGSSALSAAALALAAVTAVPAALAARRPGGERIAGAGLYLLALAVLLATSLRGNGVTGHDIKVEYRVFLETFTAGSWGPGGDNVSYNSCLSITVLPTVLARLLGLAPLDVFAVCFPLLFALVPVAVVLIARRLLPPVQALAAGLLFVAFPTFVNDMTMLNRQAIATLFFAVGVLTLLDERPSRRRTRLLAVLAVALTVSHYTTTYVAVALLLLAWAILAAPRLVRRPPALTRTGLGRAGALLAVLAIGWALFSGTAPVVRDTVRDAAAAVGTNAAVSSDATSYSLIGGSRRQSDAEALARYLDELRTSTAAEPVVPAAPQCVVRLIPADVLPISPAGTALVDVGVEPSTLNSVLRRAAVVIFQIGAMIGVLLLWWQVRSARRRGESPGPDTPVLAALAAGSLLLLAGTVIAPQLSDDYGPLRLFQQALTVLAVAVVVTVAAVARRLRAGAGGRLAVGLAIGCLLTTSGLVPQLTGDYSPQLNLNNSGDYYHAYYAQQSDLSTDSWVEDHLDHGRAVVADSRDSANVRALTGLFPRTGLAPGVVPVTEPVIVTSPDGRVATATAVVGDRVLRYQFPLACVTAGRPLLHADGDLRIYGTVQNR